MCEHVLDKVLGAETTPSGGNASSSSQNSQSDANSEGSQVPAEDRIELWCNDVVCCIETFVENNNNKITFNHLIIHRL